MTRWSIAAQIIKRQFKYWVISRNYKWFPGVYCKEFFVLFCFSFLMFYFSSLSTRPTPSLPPVLLLKLCLSISTSTFSVDFRVRTKEISVPLTPTDYSQNKSVCHLYLTREAFIYHVLFFKGFEKCQSKSPQGPYWSWGLFVCIFFVSFCLLALPLVFSMLNSFLSLQLPHQSDDRL